MVAMKANLRVLHFQYVMHAVFTDGTIFSMRCHSFSPEQGEPVTGVSYVFLHCDQ